MPYCTNCGSEYEQGAKFCTDCGQDVSESSEKDIQGSTKQDDDRGVGQRLLEDGRWMITGAVPAILAYILGLQFWFPSLGFLSLFISLIVAIPVLLISYIIIFGYISMKES